MNSLLKNISIAVLIASNLIYSTDHYDISLKYGESSLITLNCYQRIASSSEPGKTVDFPHLWRLEGLLSQSVVHLSDDMETNGERTYRIYSTTEGHRKYSALNVLGSLVILPLGLLTLTPYEQEYLFHACTPGTTCLTFICEKRYCWEAPTKVVTVTITVTDKRASKRHNLYIK